MFKRCFISFGLLALCANSASAIIVKEREPSAPYSCLTDPLCTSIFYGSGGGSSSDSGSSGPNAEDYYGPSGGGEAGTYNAPYARDQLEERSLVREDLVETNDDSSCFSPAHLETTAVEQRTCRLDHASLMRMSPVAKALEAYLGTIPPGDIREINILAPQMSVGFFHMLAEFVKAYDLTRFFPNSDFATKVWQNFFKHYLKAGTTAGLLVMTGVADDATDSLLGCNGIDWEVRNYQCRGPAGNIYKTGLMKVKKSPYYYRSKEKNFCGAPSCIQESPDFRNTPPSSLPIFYQ